jgi:excinuclease UvrABC helicase subunit UvrB
MSNLSEQTKKFPWTEFYENVKRWQSLLDKIEDKTGENFKYYSKILDYLYMLASKEKQIDAIKLEESNLREYAKFLQERNNFLEQTILKHRTADEILNDVTLLGYKNIILQNIMPEEVTGG